LDELDVSVGERSGWLRSSLRGKGVRDAWAGADAVTYRPPASGGLGDQPPVL
jgi:hypothetical protein